MVVLGWKVGWLCRLVMDFHCGLWWIIRRYLHSVQLSLTIDWMLAPNLFEVRQRLQPQYLTPMSYQSPVVGICSLHDCTHSSSLG